MNGLIPCPLLLDGPMGTELGRRGVRLNAPLWSAWALLERPEVVREIHEDYLRAGADAITTNSFRTNSRSVDRSPEQHGRGRHLTILSVEIAREAIRRLGAANALVAGSDAPVEDCYTPDLVPSDEELLNEHREHIGWLMEGGCDFVLIETMNTLREAVAACRAASELGAPFMISLVTDSRGEELLSGESFRKGAQAVNRFNPLAILTNCSSPQATLRATRLLAELREALGASWEFGGYANSGDPDPVLGYERVHTVPVDEFRDTVDTMLALGAGVVGSCCGTTPDYTAALRALIPRSGRAIVRK